jgi:Tectonin domain
MNCFRKVNSKLVLLTAIGTISILLFAFGVPEAHAAPNISGEWISNHGKTYHITQIHDKFTWRMAGSGQTGFGDLDGYTIDAIWPFGHASGTVSVDSSDRGIEIVWNNGVIFTRPGGGGGGGGVPAPSTGTWSWERVGLTASEIYAGGNNLYGVIRGSGDIYRYNGSPDNWTKVGGSGNMFVVNSGGNLYGLSPSGVFRYNGTPESWTQIGGPAAEIFIGASRLYATNPATGDIYEYNGTPHSWTRIGGPGRTFVVNDLGFLFGISPDGSGVWRYNRTPNDWTQIGGPASELFAGGSKLFATNPDTGDIYQYNGSPHNWTRVGTSGITFTVDERGYLFGLSPSGVFRYDGTPMGWTQIGDTGVDIEASRSELYGLMSDGTVWHYLP